MRQQYDLKQRREKWQRYFEEQSKYYKDNIGMAIREATELVNSEDAVIEIMNDEGIGYDEIRKMSDEKLVEFLGRVYHDGALNNS